MNQRPPGSLISYFSNRAKQDGGLNLAQGIPGFPPPPELLKLLEELSTNRNYHQYAPGVGNFRLLDQIQRCYSRSAPLTRDHLLVVQGATEGVFLSLLYLTSIKSPSAAILSFDPAYESYSKLARLLRRPFVRMPSGENGEPDRERLEQTIREHEVRIICLASPGNPLGKAWSKEEIFFLAELAETYDIHIVFDAVYKDIYYAEPPFNPLTLQNPRFIYVDSFSKMLSITGWRIGFIIAAPEHIAPMRDIHDFTGLCAPAPFQEAIARYLERNDFGSAYLSVLRRKTRDSFLAMSRELTTLGFTIPAIDGGYFIWARLPQPFDDGFAFALELYESVQLAVVPGVNFSESQTPFIRINIAAEKGVITDASRRIATFFERKSPPAGAAE